ncbi:nuclear transport factor 2 family protein [Neorhizobium sp. NCHU2750]|uniref:nuclear transport factor 2 family protein n=1 Tax=Neorhizobium sp. NCHU2750 TaxID=1825976 RepID=UPI000E759564|nr:hypothetical protein NCHU2750_07970 [Neorhizobium sp. NCHU2750]
MSENHAELVKLIYDRFNARDTDGVLAVTSEDVAWANAMEGGHVHGHAALRDYWTRQWAIVRPVVEPVAIRRLAGDAPDDKAQGIAEETIEVEVIQKIYDLEGRPLGEPSQGLKDKTVLHLFRLQDGRITRFDVRDTA